MQWSKLNSAKSSQTSLKFVFSFYGARNIFLSFVNSIVMHGNMKKHQIKTKTSGAGSQYRCGRVGRGSQPPSKPNTLSNTDTYTKSFKTLVFPLFNSCSRTNGRTNKASYSVACPQLKTWRLGARIDYS